jgi:hypothetical protein
MEAATVVLCPTKLKEISLKGLAAIVVTVNAKGFY